MSETAAIVVATLAAGGFAAVATLAAGGYTAWRQQAREIAFELYVDERMLATDAGRGLALYLDARDQALAAATELGVSEQGLSTAIRTGYLPDWLIEMARFIIMNSGPDGGINPDFLALWDRAYSSEVETADETGLVSLLGEEFPVGR